MEALPALLFITVFLTALAWAARPMPSGLVGFDEPAHQAYVDGDLARTRALLPTASLNTRVALSVAMGEYGAACDTVRREAQELLGPTHELSMAELLIRVNAADAFAESGHVDEAVAMLTEFRPFPGAWGRMVDNGRLASRAWALASVGRLAEARSDAQRVDPAALGIAYEAEGHFVKAKVQMLTGDFAGARLRLDAAANVVVRASSERNLLNLEAEWLKLQGRLEEAAVAYEKAAAHRWKGQGGPALLDWAEVLISLGRHPEARTVLERCVAQDPESPAATAAAAYLSTR